MWRRVDPNTPLEVGRRYRQVYQIERSKGLAELLFKDASKRIIDKLTEDHQEIEVVGWQDDGEFFTIEFIPKSDSVTSTAAAPALLTPMVFRALIMAVAAAIGVLLAVQFVLRDTEVWVELSEVGRSWQWMMIPLILFGVAVIIYQTGGD